MHTTSPSTILLMFSVAVGLAACRTGTNEERSGPRHEVTTIDTARTASCIRTALDHEPDSAWAMLAYCWQEAPTDAKGLLWHTYHAAMAHTAYHRTDMLATMLHCDSAINHGPARPGNSQQAYMAVLQSRVFSWVGDFDAASSSLATGLDLFRLLQDTAGMAESLEQLGWAHYRQDQFELAKQQWEAALGLRRALGDQKGLANNYRWVGIAYMETKDRARGDLYYDSALYMARLLNDPYLLSCAHDNMGLHMDSAIHFARIHGDDGLLHRVMYTAGQLHIRHGWAREGMAYCDTALAFARHTGNAVLERDAFIGLSNGYFALGMWKPAFKHLQEADRLNRRVIQGPATQEMLVKRTVLNEYRRRQIGDSMRYARELEHAQGVRALESLRADRNRSRAWAIGAGSLLLLLGGLAYYRSDLRERRARHERDAARLEVKALRAQMNPHFLFNALHSLHSYIQENDRTLASGFLVRLTKLMRMVLEHSRHDEITLEQELDALRLYMDLEQQRMNGHFDHRIEVDPDIDPATTLVPPMLIQPFVENAIWHGISAKEGRGRITVQVRAADGQLLIAVEDDGVGRDHGKADRAQAAAGEKTSLGTRITQERLDLLTQRSGSAATMRYDDLPNGTRVEVELPWVREE